MRARQRLRRRLLVALLAATACRPASYERPVRVQVPLADAMTLPHYAGPSESLVEVPEGSLPRVLRPDARIEVQVPADVELPRSMQGG